MLGRRLVAFRSETGAVAVLDAHCAHQGADLGCGSVSGSTIRCPFHHWRYGMNGTCVGIPGEEEIPSWAHLRCYPATERHGFVFVFNGNRPLFPLPFLVGEDPADYVASKPFRYVADCTWYANAAHAFDTRHFAAVHDRELLGPVEIDCPASHARRNRYQARVVGETLFDRTLRLFVGGTVRTSLTIWGGTFAVVTADFPRARSAFLISMLPLEDGRTLCEGMVFARRCAVPGLNAVGLRTRRLFTHGYLAEEARQLRRTRYNPTGFTGQDADVVDFYWWLEDRTGSAEEEARKEVQSART